MPTIPGYSSVMDASFRAAEVDEAGQVSFARRAATARAASASFRAISVALAGATAARPREALSDVMTRNARVGEHLALIEMLLAVGPAVRDAGALEDALVLLEAMEEGLESSISALREACAPSAES